MQKPLRVLLLALVLVSIPFLSNAQTTIETELSAPDARSYPEIQAYLFAQSDSGRFLSDLAPSDVVIVENGTEIPVDTLEVLQPGAQITLAIDPSPAFSVRDSTGASRYDIVLAALDTWLENQDDRDGDLLSVFMTSNQEFLNLKTYGAVEAVLDVLPTDHRSSTTNINTLYKAITIPGEPTEGPGKSRAVLYIGPEADTDALNALDEITEAALQNDVRVFVWMVTSEAYFTTNGAKALENLTEATGGQFFAFSGTQTLPDPEDYFDGLRKVYSLAYASRIRSSGQFEIAARISKSGAESTTPPVVLSLTILPPNPIFVSPPDDIYRSLVPDSDGNLSAERRTPAEQNIDILIEFPDGFPRDLVRTTLYVDGVIVAENTAPPFDRFTWELDAIQESGRFTLQVEALDSLGLSSISLETPVNITVQRMPEGFAPTIAQNSPLIVTVVVLLVGSVLIVVLLRFRKMRPEVQPGNGRPRTRPRPSTDPVYQPVQPESKPVAVERLSRWTNRLHWPQRSSPRGEPIAFLERLYDYNSLEALTPIPPFSIHTTEVTLGNDPNQATIVLEEPTVAALHARLFQNAHREFYISDFGSISGTYVNYKPTNGTQTRIEHGDQVHFGTVGFRFSINPPPQLSLPSINETEEKES